MIGRFVLFVLCMAAAVGGCSNGDTVTVTHNAEDGGSWANWHAEKRSVDRVADAAINEPGGGDYAKAAAAINEPGGGDYAKAADAIRGSSRPPAVKQFELGQLIVGGIMDDAPRRPPEDLEQGLRMMEDSTVTAGQKDEGAVQQLRFLFERGDGKPPHGFPTDPKVAACWLAVEERRSDDPAGCIILRRSRMPHVGG